MLTTVGVQFGLVAAQALYLDYPLVINKFQIWRTLTNFCFLGPFSFPFVMRIMMMCVRGGYGFRAQGVARRAQGSGLRVKV
jgi:Derlin-2/3